MPNKRHVALLQRGVDAWNAWRAKNPDIRPDLSSADLTSANLGGANLSKANLTKANLSGASLTKANLFAADLSRANLNKARLFSANLTSAKLVLTKLVDAQLMGANLSRATLTGTNLSRANLVATRLVEAKFTGADLTGCRVYGVSAWGLKLDEGTQQKNLIITRGYEPEITVDNIEVAQFVYLMLHNQKIRDVIDTLTSKTVLILGRFTDERKAVLDALRDELRSRNYLPILFDFDIPAARDITETVTLLARMARFIIADLTDPLAVFKELQAIVPEVVVPVQPLLEASSQLPYTPRDFWKYDWMLPLYRYKGLEPLLATLAKKVIAPAERKVEALRKRRRKIEAELAKASIAGSAAGVRAVPRRPASRSGGH